MYRKLLTAFLMIALGVTGFLALALDAVGAAAAMLPQPESAVSPFTAPFAAVKSGADGEVEGAAAAQVCTAYPTRILPIGDTITRGDYSSHEGGYRFPLWLDLRNAGYDIAYTGYLTAGPPPPGFDHDHEGSSIRRTIPMVRDNIENMMNTRGADVVLLHIGTVDVNSINETFTVTHMIDQMTTLLDNVDAFELAQGREIPVVLAQIINRPCDGKAGPAVATCQTAVANTSDFNDALETLVQTRVANGDNIVLVNMEDDAGLVYSELSGDFGNDLHPNDSGYEKMADLWFNALETVLPATCDTPPLIASVPATQTAAQQRYLYQVIGSGHPAVTYSLAPTAPLGMEMDPITNLVEWAPTQAQTGTHSIVVHATNGISSTQQVYDLEVVDTGLGALQSPRKGLILNGETGTFTVHLTNTLTETLTAVDVSFAEFPACNTTAGPIDPDGQTQVTCDVSNIVAPVTSTVSISVTDPLSPPLSALDIGTITPISPGLSIVQTPQQPILYNGDSATFTVQITNTGDVTLSDVTVVNQVTADCDRTNLGELAAGASTSYTCSSDALTADLSSQIMVTGTHSLGTVNDTDTAVVDTIDPDLDFTITADASQILSGSDVTFTLALTNTGDVALSSVEVNDTAVLACAQSIGTLAIGADTSFECTASNVTADFVHQPVVSATHPLDTISRTDSVLVDVFSPDVDITKLPDFQYALRGSDVTFDIVVTNTSGTEMSNVMVSDPMTGCSQNLGTLADMAQQTVECTATNVQADFSAAAQVTGTLPIVGQVSSSDLASVDVIDPAIVVTITPASQSIFVGETAVFNVKVRNDGDIALSGVSVAAPNAANCRRSNLGTLAAQSETTYQCTVTQKTDNFSVQVTAAGNHPLGSVTDHDTAVVEVEMYMLYLPAIIK